MRAAAVLEYGRQQQRRQAERDAAVSAELVRLTLGGKPDRPELTICGAVYGSNPDPCHQRPGHRDPHSNVWGTTWVSSVDAAGLEPAAFAL